MRITFKTCFASELEKLKIQSKDILISPLYSYIQSYSINA